MPDGGCDILPLPAPPAEARPLAEAIGVDGLLRLIEARGGTCVQLGDRAMPDRKLADRLGLSAAEMKRLRKAFGKTRIRVPLLRPWRARIYKARGMSYADIALKLGVSDIAVYAYLRDAGMTNQLALKI